MAELEYPVLPIEVDYICDTCKKGRMRPPKNGTTQNTNPPKFQHECLNCKESVFFHVRYPLIRYKPILPKEKDKNKK